MGYTHYWRREKEINQFTFISILRDFQNVMPNLKIAEISLDQNEIAFDGIGETCETFVFERTFTPYYEGQKPDESGRYYNFCKTARLPYDLAVQVALIIAKRHLGDNIKIASDGNPSEWTKAIWYCQDRLGYGESFELEESCE